MQQDHEPPRRTCENLRVTSQELEDRHFPPFIAVETAKWIPTMEPHVQRMEYMYATCSVPVSVWRETCAGLQFSCPH